VGPAWRWERGAVSWVGLVLGCGPSGLLASFFYFFSFCFLFILFLISVLGIEKAIIPIFE
jgi:hypothetical protein